MCQSSPHNLGSKPCSEVCSYKPLNHPVIIRSLKFLFHKWVHFAATWNTHMVKNVNIFQYSKRGNVLKPIEKVFFPTDLLSKRTIGEYRVHLKNRIFWKIYQFFESLEAFFSIDEVGTKLNSWNFVLSHFWKKKSFFDIFIRNLAHMAVKIYSPLTSDRKVMRVKF